MLINVRKFQKVFIHIFFKIDASRSVLKRLKMYVFS